MIKYSTKNKLIYASLTILTLLLIIQVFRASKYVKGIYSLISFIFVIFLLSELPKIFISKYKQYTDGQDAEDYVEDLLYCLPTDYKFIVDVVLSDRGNIDAVVIGPRGVYTLEVKSHWGKISFDGQELKINGDYFEKDFLKQSYAQSKVVENLIKEKLGYSIYVKPVIVFTRAKINFGLKSLKGVNVINAHCLKNFIVTGDHNINPEIGEKLYNLILSENKKL